MLPVGEQHFTDLLKSSLASKRALLAKALSMINIPTLCITAGLVISDDIAISALPYVNHALPAVSKRIAQIFSSGSIMWIGTVAVFTVQTVYHTYRYFRGDITWQQLAKYTVVNAASGLAGVGGGVVGGVSGALIGSFLPGLGTLIGGIIGSIIGTVLIGGGVQVLGTFLGNKLVNDEEHFRKAESRKQYAKALELFNMKVADVTRESVEKRKKILYKMYHPDKFSEAEAKQVAHEKFLAVCGAYYVIMLENKFMEPPSETAPLLLL